MTADGGSPSSRPAGPAGWKGASCSASRRKASSGWSRGSSTSCRLETGTSGSASAAAQTATRPGPAQYAPPSTTGWMGARLSTGSCHRFNGCSSVAERNRGTYLSFLVGGGGVHFLKELALGRAVVWRGDVCGAVLSAVGATWRRRSLPVPVEWQQLQLQEQLCLQIFRGWVRGSVRASWEWASLLNAKSHRRPNHRPAFSQVVPQEVKEWLTGVCL